MNRAFLGAFRKGLRTGRVEHAQTSPQFEEGYRQIPYNLYATAKIGKGRRVPTFERAFANFWMTGFKAGFDGCDCPNPCPNKIYHDDMAWHYSESCPVHDG